jgi:hypothetical protein
LIAARLRPTGRRRMNEGTIGMIPRRRFHRTVFVAAGLYNIAWGLWSALDPQWLFRIASLEPLNHPSIFACLAMVIGLYGILYLEVARRPEQGWLIAAVGLAGKILGPIGLSVLIVRGVWPPSTIILCVTNDFIWWLPFGFYLNDSWTFFTRSFVPDQKDERVR